MLQQRNLNSQYKHAMNHIESIKDFSSRFSEPRKLSKCRNPKIADPLRRNETLSKVPPNYRPLVEEQISVYEASLRNLINKTELEEEDLVKQYQDLLDSDIQKIYHARKQQGQSVFSSGQEFVISSVSVQVARNESSSDTNSNDQEVYDSAQSSPREVPKNSLLVKSDAQISKKRASISKDSKRFLEAVFEAKRMPNSQERQAIAEKCGLTPLQVRVWFTNKRMRSKST